MAAISSNGTGGGDWDIGASWAGAVAPGSGDTVTILNGDTITQTQAEAATSVTIDAGGELDNATFNLAISGKLDVSGTLTQGSSADTGITAGNIEFHTGASRDWQEDSKVTCNGDYVEPNSSVSVNNRRGCLTMGGDGNLTKPSITNYLCGFKIDAGVTVTAIGLICRINDNLCGNVEINGTLNTSGSWCTIGCNSSYSFVIGVNGDFSGGGDLSLDIVHGATVTNNRATAFSHTGLVGTVGTAKDCDIPAWDFSNSSEVRVNTYTSGNMTRYFTAGTLKTKLFVIKSTSGRTHTIKADTNNPSFEHSDNVDFNDGDGTIIYVKGTGTRTFNASSGTQTLAGDSQSVEDITQNNSGATLQLTENITTDSFTGLAGTFDPNGKTITTGGIFTLGQNIDVNTTGLAGSTWIVGGNFSVYGSDGDLMTLNAASAWTLTVTGTATASYVNAKNSDASGGTTIAATDSTDSGGNNNWDFGAVAGISAHYGMTLVKPNTLVMT